jgi:lipid-binding SYLF domain-containing protein
MSVPAAGKNDSGETDMRKLFTILAAVVLIGIPFASMSAQHKEADRLQNAGMVLEEILNIPDDIPSDLLNKAECVIVAPSVVKFAIGLGGSYGRGAMTCRGGANFTGPWGAPTMIAIEGGSFGFQLGGQATDFILLVMNPRGANSILRSKVKLGADAAAAAGPKGRDAAAATDATLRAEILTYSRSRGLFAGVSLEGSTLRPDNGANEDVYGRKVAAEDIVRKGAAQAPAAAGKLISLLNQKSPNNTSDPASLR